MQLSIYGHAGSSNHGNEAIVRGFCQLFNNRHIYLYSFSPDLDKNFELDHVCEIKDLQRQYKRYSIEHFISSFLYRAASNSKIQMGYRFQPLLKNIDGIYLLEAGDQYCEADNIREMYAYLNKEINARRGKTVMLPCTIKHEFFSNTNLINDLKRYSIIFARESITYNALLEAGLEEKARFAPCPAFLMEPKPCVLPELFLNEQIIGITIGQLAQGKEAYSENVLKNTKALIEYILKNTDYAVALIPHVNAGDKLTDMTFLKVLYDEFKNSERIVIIGEKRADELKYIIGNCCFLVTVRTHASIAGYSSGVPTLVIGYSQKSKGIAIDLFGTSQDYVVSVDSLDIKQKLTEAFIKIIDNETEIRNHLTEVLPSYLEKVRVTYDEIIKLAGEEVA